MNNTQINTNELLSELVKESFEIAKEQILEEQGEMIKNDGFDIDIGLYEILNQEIIFPNPETNPFVSIPVECDEYGNVTEEGIKTEKKITDQWVGSVSVGHGIFYDDIGKKLVSFNPLKLFIGSRLLVAFSLGEPAKWGNGITSETDLDKWYWGTK